MDRIERRRNLLRLRREAPFDAHQRHVETALRSRTARRVRAHIRQLEPVAMVTPRWSAPQRFLEDLALDLAVGEPEVICRTVSLRPLMGRSQVEAWNFVLRVMGDLCGPDFARRPLPIVCERSAFRCAAEEIVELAHDEAAGAVALLLHGTEHLPFETLSDLGDVFLRYAEAARDNRRVGLLTAGSVETPASRMTEITAVELNDFGEAEAAARLVMRLGALDLGLLQRAAALSGGVPAIVDALVEHGMREGRAPPPPPPASGFRVTRVPASTLGLPGDPESLIRAIGPLAEELRDSVTMALAEPRVAGRFYRLADQGAQVESPTEDAPLLLSGLARRVRSPSGTALVELRSPALSALAS